ncbi:hypothetical protein OH76DRAFT_1269349 [Lentinus brumalis]|uniref:Uncharacterized protein n=1 Tax=Lentinus brumalis TaxID=2498619 RepID=A0A371CR69_9APHY|nr:hypothetical protein OH76DRAFT_1269349 [Polyporus brumalis]
MGSGKKSYDINAVYCRLRIGFDHPVSETTSTHAHTSWGGRDDEGSRLCRALGYLESGRASGHSNSRTRSGHDAAGRVLKVLFGFGLRGIKNVHERLSRFESCEEAGQYASADRLSDSSDLTRTGDKGAPLRLIWYARRWSKIAEHRELENQHRSGAPLLDPRSILARE